jgi:hypothetical protein
MRSCVRSVQICASFSGGFWPISLPFFQQTPQAQQRSQLSQANTEQTSVDDAPAGSSRP